MRIALLTYSTKPRGGVVHTLALAEALASRGHEVTVWSLARGGDTAFFRPVSAAVSVRLVNFPDLVEESVGSRVVRSISLLSEALQGFSYNIVHAQDCITANAAMQSTAGGAGDRCVRTVHHLDHFTTPQLAACHERALRGPRAHLCVSAAVAAELREGWGISAEVIPNGVFAERFASASAASVACWRDEVGPAYVLTVGGIEPRKGTLDLVEAMALLPGRPLVVGGGDTLFDYRDYRAAVLDRAAALGVDLRVLGPVAESRLPGLVAGAAVFAFPSLAEGFGLAAMEALAAGVPLVARDLPVFREVFDGAALFASDPAGFAAALAELPSVPRTAAGRELAARHTWEAAAEAHEEFYLSLG